MKTLTLLPTAFLATSLSVSSLLPAQKNRTPSAEEVSAEALPAAVTRSLQATYPKATIVAVYQVTRGTEVRYQIDLKAADADSRFSLMATPDGKVRTGAKAAATGAPAKSPSQKRLKSAGNKDAIPQPALENHAQHNLPPMGGARPRSDLANLDILRDTVISASGTYAGGHIGPGATLTIDPAAAVTLTFTQNVIVEGSLVSHPQAGVTHTIRFEGVDESAYIGGGHAPLDSDVGLWVTGGRLDLAGAETVSWTRLSAGATAGTGLLTVEENPTGWHAGDTLVIAPTRAPSTGRGFSIEFDEARIASVDGHTVRLASPLLYDHPVADGRWKAEAFVLNRNMVVEGTPGGRAHIWIRSNQPQQLSNVEIRYMGPLNAADPDATVLGRYPLHFHHSENGTRGTIVRNVVVHHSANRAFVAHASYGITFTGTVAYDVQQTPYWWDPPVRTEQKKVVDRSNDGQDITYDHALAALVRPGVPVRGYRLAGFQVNAGMNLRLIDSVAVGVQGNKNSSGFHWPENESDQPWVFEGNIAHNNARDGIFVWQNAKQRHHVTNFIAYHNGGAGVEHGAYGNAFLYDRLQLFGNLEAGIRLHAEGRDDLGGLIFRCVDVDGGGITRAGTLINASPVQGNAARFRGVSIHNITGFDFTLLPDASARGDTIERRIRREASDCSE